MKLIKKELQLKKKKKSKRRQKVPIPNTKAMASFGTVAMVKKEKRKK